MEKFLEYIIAHKWTCIITLLGILFTILVFVINFWRTLLLTIVVTICVYIGSSIDKKHKASSMFRDDD